MSMEIMTKCAKGSMQCSDSMINIQGNIAPTCTRIQRKRRRRPRQRKKNNITKEKWVLLCTRGETSRANNKCFFHCVCVILFSFIAFFYLLTCFIVEVTWSGYERHFFFIYITTTTTKTKLKEKKTQKETKNKTTMYSKPR